MDAAVHRRCAAGVGEGDGERLTINLGAAYRFLFSSSPLPRLRRFKTGVIWGDWDASLIALISLSYKLPHLDELILTDGDISANGFAALAAAGRAGRWPRLKLFQIQGVVAEAGNVYSDEAGKEFCRSLLQYVWADLEVKFWR
jgi:hypothetical protein